MMIATFLKQHQLEMKNIIAEFAVGQEFSSHDFIEKFSAEFESDYIDMLVKYKKSGKAFQTVHSMVAGFLSQSTAYFGIEKTERKGSENVHGNVSGVQWWKRIN